MGKHTRAPSGGSPPSLQRDQDAVLARLADSQALSDQSLPRITELIERFCAFGKRAFDIAALAEVTPVQAAAFVQAPMSAGEVSAATMHLRRSALRLLFRLARELDLADSDPTIDLTLPARSSKGTRPLTDDEVALCRSASLQSLTSTRLAAVWALAESSCRSGELGHIRIADIDLDAGQVWLHGSPRTEARWAPLQEWGATQVERRLRVLGDNPDRLIVYDGERGSDYHRQACGGLINVFGGRCGGFVAFGRSGRWAL